MTRGRPRKLEPSKSKPVASDFRHEHLSKIVKDDRQRQSSKKVVDEWYHVSKNKVRLIRRWNNGNVSSQYCGKHKRLKATSKYAPFKFPPGAKVTGL